MVKSVARFTHDCEQCVFLGQIADEDVWCCVRAGEAVETTSVILRTSDEGPDYASFTLSMARMAAGMGGVNAARWAVAVDMVEEYLEAG